MPMILVVALIMQHALQMHPPFLCFCHIAIQFAMNHSVFLRTEPLVRPADCVFRFWKTLGAQNVQIAVSIKILNLNMSFQLRQFPSVPVV